MPEALKSGLPTAVTGESVPSPALSVAPEQANGTPQQLRLLRVLDVSDSDAISTNGHHPLNGHGSHNGLHGEQLKPLTRTEVIDKLAPLFLGEAGAKSVNELKSLPSDIAVKRYVLLRGRGIDETSAISRIEQINARFQARQQESANTEPASSQESTPLPADSAKVAQDTKTETKKSGGSPEPRGVPIAEFDQVMGFTRASTMSLLGLDSRERAALIAEYMRPDPRELPEAQRITRIEEIQKAQRIAAEEARKAAEERRVAEAQRMQPGTYEQAAGFARTETVPLDEQDPRTDTSAYQRQRWKEQSERNVAEAVRLFALAHGETNEVTMPDPSIRGRIANVFDSARTIPQTLAADGRRLREAIGERISEAQAKRDREKRTKNYHVALDPDLQNNEVQQELKDSRKKVATAIRQSAATHPNAVVGFGRRLKELSKNPTVRTAGTVGIAVAATFGVDHILEQPQLSSVRNQAASFAHNGLALLQLIDGNYLVNTDILTTNESYSGAQALSTPESSENAAYIPVKQDGFVSLIPENDLQTLAEGQDTTLHGYLMISPLEPQESDGVQIAPLFTLASGEEPNLSEAVRITENNDIAISVIPAHGLRYELLVLNGEIQYVGGKAAIVGRGEIIPGVTDAADPEFANAIRYEQLLGQQPDQAQGVFKDVSSTVRGVFQKYRPFIPELRVFFSQRTPEYNEAFETTSNYIVFNHSLAEIGDDRTEREIIERAFRSAIFEYAKTENTDAYRQFIEAYNRAYDAGAYPGAVNPEIIDYANVLDIIAEVTSDPLLQQNNGGNLNAEETFIHVVSLLHNPDALGPFLNKSSKDICDRSIDNEEYKRLTNQQRRLIQGLTRATYNVYVGFNNVNADISAMFPHEKQLIDDDLAIRDSTASFDLPTTTPYPTPTPATPTPISSVTPTATPETPTPTPLPLPSYCDTPTPIPVTSAEPASGISGSDETTPLAAAVPTAVRDGGRNEGFQTIGDPTGVASAGDVPSDAQESLTTTTRTTQFIAANYIMGYEPDLSTGEMLGQAR